MAQEQERLQQIASTFGDSDIKMFVGRDKVFPDKSVSDAKVQQLENGLRSPQQEQSSIRVTQANQTIYRSQAGAVTVDAKNLSPQFRGVAPEQKRDYFELLNSRLERAGVEPYTPESLRDEIQEVQQKWGDKDHGIDHDLVVVREAVERGFTPEATQAVLAESPGREAFLKLETDPAAIDKYQQTLETEFAKHSKEFEAKLEAEKAPTQEVAQITTAATPQPSIPQLDLSAFSNSTLPHPPQTKDEQIRAAVEPKLVEQMSQSFPKSADPGGAMVLAKSKAVIPIEPTPPQLEQKMPAMVTPPKASDHESLTKALAVANSRIDHLQGQLNSTNAALKNLQTQAHDRSLKGWASNTAQKIGNTAQTFAAQAKANVVQWVGKGIAQVQALSQSIGDKVNQVKAAAQTTVGDVKTAVHVKTIEAKEAVRTKVNDALSPVDSAALTKAADQMINQWGHAGKFEGNTFDFQRSSAGEISIHTKDGTPVFAKGTVTPQANAKTIAHLSEIPRRVELAQNHNPTVQQTAKPALAR